MSRTKGSGTLNARQEKFAQKVAKGLSKTQAAMDAGYSPKNAARAGVMLSGKNHPKIQARINELQKRAANRVTLTLASHLTDLKDIRDQALQNGSYSSAVAAEVARGKAAGLYVNKSELTINKIELMSKEEILVRMQELYHETGGILPKSTIIDLPVEEYSG
jgi:phage terminase small subunit|tara:strand:- start:50 stop:535 length:486 start_codon:yes stop_codon:yes gene_type:complete